MTQIHFLRGFWKLTWVETKVFTREPMGFIGTLIMPLLVFIALGRAFGGGKPVAAPVDIPFNAAILAALLIAISAVQSLVGRSSPSIGKGASSSASARHRFPPLRSWARRLS
ncbi:MAG: hypothetical protein NVSMB53_06010 [Gemmatimonadaceae bacterium]